jgi:hypothetical protein
MILVRILVNAVIMLLELAAICAIAWCGWRYPVPFALVTAALGFGLGVSLERARLANEIGFYLEEGHPRRPLLIGSVALAEAATKGLIGGVAALLTFSGTDSARLVWVAIVFAACLFAGTSLLRGLRLGLGARPLRWGYFRLSAPLGMLFSAGIAALVIAHLLPSTSLGDLSKRLLLDTPARPSIPQASELLFLFKQYFDEVIVSLLASVVGRDWAALLGVLLSVNMLTGFVVALYAMLIAEAVRQMERVR